MDPIDLTSKTMLNQKLNKHVSDRNPKVVRKVYGLKKVFSSGIGASGNASDAVIGKLGNTLDGEIDTVSATNEDLQGSLVSISTVTSKPRPKKVVKPEYTVEMLKNKVEGKVRVKVLIDIDGKVKRVIVLDDLGFGSKEKTFEACMNFLFEPAMVGEKPVASWIPLSIRFEMRS